MYAIFKAIKKRNANQQEDESSKAAKDAELAIKPQEQNENDDAAKPTPAATPLSQDGKNRVSTKQMIIQVTTMLVIDIGLPLAIYYILKPYLGYIWALVLGGVPPFLWVIFKFIKTRKLDVLGVLMVVSFIVSAILGIITGDPRDLLLRESVITCLFGLIFLGTLIPIKTKTFELRPLIFYLSRQMFVHLPTIINEITGEPEHTFDWTWRLFPRYRFNMRCLSAFWGVILVGEFIGKVIAIRSSLTIDQLVIFSNALLGAVMGFGFVTTIIWSHSMRRRSMHEIEIYKRDHNVQIV